MKLYEMAEKAIREQNARLAEGVILRLNRVYNLNAEGVLEYLVIHGVDVGAWDELVSAI